jgi:hypothetical protein
MVLIGRATGGGSASSPLPHPDVSRAVTSGSRRPRFTAGDLVMIPALRFTVLDPFVSQSDWSSGWLVI